MTKEQHDQARRELGFAPDEGDEPRYVETTYRTIGGGSVTYKTQVVTRQIKPKGVAQ